ncbi:MAG: hypothetical protein II685_07420, partial [Clostridia bacterium]|nr:hypothetical protein [Clostridia bacterium]
YAFIQEYYYAKSHSDAFELIKEYSGYLSTVSETQEIKCWFVIENGWDRLFFAGADYILLVFLLFISCYTWKIERSTNVSKGAFLQIMLTSKNGRKQTVKNKFLSVMIGTAAAFLFSTCTRLWFIAIRFGFAGLDAPLVSLRSFDGAPSGLTIGGYLLLYLSVQFVLYSVVAAVIFVTAQISRNASALFAASSAVVFMPPLLKSLGISAAKYVDITELIGFSALFVSNKRFSALLMLLLALPALYIAAVKKIEKGNML